MYISTTPLTRSALGSPSLHQCIATGCLSAGTASCLPVAAAPAWKPDPHRERYTILLRKQ